MNVGFGTEAARFHFGEYLVRIFDILSLQCEPQVSLLLLLPDLSEYNHFKGRCAVTKTGTS
jgi:hypothetical protein